MGLGQTAKEVENSLFLTSLARAVPTADRVICLGIWYFQLIFARSPSAVTPSD